MIEPESPGYLAFRSEPDFRRSAGRIIDFRLIDLIYVLQIGDR